MSQLSVVLLVAIIAGSASAGPAVAPVAVQEVFQPFEYGYELGDGLGMTQHRREVADGTGAVSGSYGYTDPIGVYRKVEYSAGADGYKAVIHSNEPGLSSHAVGDAVYIVELPPPAAVAQGLRAAVPQLSV